MLLPRQFEYLLKISQGPLSPERKQLVERLRPILKTGDILYRGSDARGPLGLPFSRLIGWLTGSPFTHAALYVEYDVFVEGSKITEPFVMEVNDTGTNLVRLVDWLETCYSKKFRAYRLRYWDVLKCHSLQTQIYLYLQRDPQYDFTFSDPDKVYCTESVVEIYRNIGVELVPPTTLWESVPWYTYCGLWLADKIARRFSKTGLPMSDPIYYPGTEKKGMIASDRTVPVFSYPE